MKIEVNFAELNSLMKKMGAAPSAWRPSAARLNPREQLIRELEEGKEISLDQLTAVAGGLLTYKGEQVVLYIKDTRLDEYTLLNDIENSRRFHIFDCRTLDTMRVSGRFERYVVTRRRDGMFPVEATDPDTRRVTQLEARLGVCKNCLMQLNWNAYQELDGVSRKKIWIDFSIEDFLAEFATFFRTRPIHSDETAPQGGYAPDWSKRARRLKDSRGWKCEKCNVSLLQHKWLLHAHHKNGVVADNRDENLKALCVVCHSEEPAHSYLKPSVSDRLLIEKLRLEQGVHSP